MGAARRVMKKVVKFLAYTAFLFDILLISLGIGSMGWGESFLQGIIETLENGWMVLYLSFVSAFFAGDSMFNFTGKLIKEIKKWVHSK